VAAGGGLGVAAFGVAEGLKRWPWIGDAGFRALEETLGQALVDTLNKAYGQGATHLLRALYRGDHGELRRVIRQGARVGATDGDINGLAKLVGMEPKPLTKALVSQDPDSNKLGVIGRFELAIDARIDAGLTLAKSQYVRSIRLTAAVVAIVVALLVTALIVESPTRDDWILATIVGLLAVPVAPVAKDLSLAVRAAAQALRARS